MKNDNEPEDTQGWRGCIIVVIVITLILLLASGVDLGILYILFAIIVFFIK